MKSASLTVFDPGLIDGVRSTIADEFARRIFDAIPDISDCIEFEAEACDSAAGKRRFERASQMLFSRRRELQAQTAMVVRRIFDEKLELLRNGVDPAAKLSLDGLTLLTDERLDEEIAINQCSRRLKEQCEFDLWGLTRRIVALTGAKHPPDNLNPIVPQTFAQALMEALGSIETDAGVRLVVFKTFGPVLLEIVPATYAMANRNLTARGIDVDGGEYYGRPVLTAERQSAPPPTQQEVNLGAMKSNQELTSALTKILARSSSGTPLYLPPPLTEGDSSSLAATVQLPTLAAEPGWHAPLKSIETENRDGDGEPSPGTRTLHDNRRAMQERLTRDEQVIGDIITVMFDRLMVDPRLPAQLREAVARLQLPVLALALKDRSLLTQVQHPVRKLIDLIAEFGLTLGLDDDDDTTVRSVANIVDGLVQICDSEPGAFRQAFDQLDDFFYHHEEAALQDDENLRALEHKEATEFAGHQADREIAVRMQNLILPPVISHFIQTTWRDVMIHDFMHGGPLGKPWKLGLATLDDLVKCLRPSTVEGERRRLANRLPSFIEIMLIGPETDDDHDVAAANFFAELERMLALALDGRWSAIGGERFVPAAGALDEPVSMPSPSAALASLDIACGDWIETGDFAGTRRWRLNWITPILGTCVFRHYESNTTRNMGCEELRERLASGEVQRVRGLGLADEILNSAFETVTRKARREEALLAARAPSAANRDASNREATHQWGPLSQTTPPHQDPSAGRVHFG